MSNIIVNPWTISRLQNKLEEAGLPRELAESSVLAPFLEKAAAESGASDKLSVPEMQSAISAYLQDRIGAGTYGEIKAKKVFDALSKTLEGLGNADRKAAEKFLAQQLGSSGATTPTTPPPSPGGVQSPLGILAKPPIVGAKEPDERTTLSNAEWDKVFALMDKEGERFGLPAKSDDSFLFGSFNIRKMGAVDKKTEGAWKFFERIIQRFDVCNIQEVQDDMTGLDLVVSRLPRGFKRYYTDTTGGDHARAAQGEQIGMEERMVTIFNEKCVHPEGMGSDLSFDSSSVIQSLIDSSPKWLEAKAAYDEKLAEWEKKQEGPKPTFDPPDVFVDFVRTPSKVSFMVGPDGREQKVLVVNAHLLYGDTYTERRLEFDALVHALVQAAEEGWTVFFGGDCNLKFDNPDKDRAAMRERLGHLTEALAERGLRFNLPHIYPHPERGVMRTNSRENQTYDVIGMVGADEWIPDRSWNETAGSEPGGFDYGVFNFVDLISEALHGKPFAELSKAEQKKFLRKIEHDISDHMPIWTRIPVPDETKTAAAEQAES